MVGESIGPRLLFRSIARHRHVARISSELNGVCVDYGVTIFLESMLVPVSNLCMQESTWACVIFRKIVSTQKRSFHVLQRCEP